MTVTTSRRYENVVSAAMEKPWAILPAKLALLAEVLALRLDGQRFTDEELVERLGAKPKRSQAQSGAVQVIPVYGTIVPRGASYQDVSGGQATSMEQLIHEINAAAQDGNISAILLDVDSPGGQTDMMPEAAAAVRNARAAKPVVAVANTMAASAAYWLASQATELVVTPSGEVGSIGVFAVHNDLSEQLKALGVNPTLIKAGKYKAELSPLQPLTDEARAYVQEGVDHFYNLFTSDVAKGRGVQVSAVRDGFGEGRMVNAAEAVKMGMADRVDTLDNTLSRLVRGQFPVHRGALAEIDAPVELVEMLNGTAGGSVTITETIYPPLNSNDLSWSVSGGGEQQGEILTVTEAVASEEETSDPEPQGQLAELRRSSREAATSERQEYLNLLRRIK